MGKGYAPTEGRFKPVKAVYSMEGGQFKPRSKAYVLSGGAFHMWYQRGKPLGELETGTIIKIKRDGVLTEFVVIHQGTPAEEYGTGADGTWVLLREPVQSLNYGVNPNISDYTTSNAYYYLQRWVDSTDAAIRPFLKEPKFPCMMAGNGSYYGRVLISASAFLLSMTELGLGSWNDGAALPYFDSDEKRLAPNSGGSGGVPYWTRTPYLIGGSATMTYLINETGAGVAIDPRNSLLLRPAMVLSSDLLVLEDGTVCVDESLYTQLGDIPVGTTVRIKGVGEITYQFIIVHQGKPSELYDDSCDGTWLMMQNTVTTMRFSSELNEYANSDLHTWLQNNFLALMKGGGITQLKEVKIPYCKDADSEASAGADGLAAKAFLLSLREMGIDDGFNCPDDGAKLDYFEAGKTDEAKALRIAKDSSGTAVEYWTRSLFAPQDDAAYFIKADGAYSNKTCGWTGGAVRPAMILAKTAKVTRDGFVVA